MKKESQRPKRSGKVKKKKRLNKAMKKRNRLSRKAPPYRWGTKSRRGWKVSRGSLRIRKQPTARFRKKKELMEKHAGRVRGKRNFSSKDRTEVKKVKHRSRRRKKKYPKKLTSL